MHMYMKTQGLINARGLKLKIFGEPRRRMRGFGELTLFLHNFQSLMQEEREKERDWRVSLRADDST